MESWLVSLNTASFWGSLLNLLIIGCLSLWVVRRTSQVSQLKKSVHQLENQILAMNSGHLGMGKQIKQVIKEMANVEEIQQSQAVLSPNEKTYEQASLLLSRGATIEEVVESCEITPSEAELLAIMSHSAPAATLKSARSH